MVSNKLHEQKGFTRG
jgi:hypothetical protein